MFPCESSACENAADDVGTLPPGGSGVNRFGPEAVVNSPDPTSAGFRLNVAGCWDVGSAEVEKSGTPASRRTRKRGFERIIPNLLLHQIITRFPSSRDLTIRAHLLTLFSLFAIARGVFSCRNLLSQLRVPVWCASHSALSMIAKRFTKFSMKDSSATLALLLMASPSSFLPATAARMTFSTFTALLPAACFATPAAEFRSASRSHCSMAWCWRARFLITQ